MAPSDQRLSQQRAIVTGASSGIGAQIARVFARAGATVGVNYRGGAAAADAIGREIHDASGQAMVLLRRARRSQGWVIPFPAAVIGVGARPAEPIGEGRVYDGKSCR